jgi:hypothetical protein
LLTLFVVFALAVSPARATVHLMQIEQVIGGVNGDTTAQAVQLRMRSVFQNQMQQAKLWAWDAQGLNPVLLIDFLAPVVNHGAGVTILVASPGLATYTSPAVVPDFTMTNLIPASYLAAGSITFENNLGSIIYWRLSWGGGSYTGPTTGAITNDPDGEFGPPYAGALPSSDLQALVFPGLATAASTNNAADYALTGGAAVFTNNAGAGFTVTAPVTCATCVGDVSENAVVDGNDIRDFVTCFLGGDPSAAGCGCADMDASSAFDQDDVLMFVSTLLQPAPSCP